MDADGQVAQLETKVRDLLDAMRNAHLQMVIGSPHRALQYVDDAERACAQLQEQFDQSRTAQILASALMLQVLRERAASLRGLIGESLISPKTPEEVVDFVARPLPPTSPRL